MTNPQLAQHSYRQEPVAICIVALHSSHPNAGMKQYECGHTQPLMNEAVVNGKLAVETYKVKTSVPDRNPDPDPPDPHVF